MLATIMQRITMPLDRVSARQIMQAAVARPPMRTCPSAPMFQKRILKAGVTAREMPSRMARSWAVIQVRRAVPKAPSKMVT